jgi:hypothetical protein
MPDNAVMEALYSPRNQERIDCSCLKPLNTIAQSNLLSDTGRHVVSKWIDAKQQPKYCCFIHRLGTKHDWWNQQIVTLPFPGILICPRSARHIAQQIKESACSSSLVL